MSVRMLLESMDSREISEWIALGMVEREERLRRDAEARAARALEEVRGRRR